MTNAAAPLVVMNVEQLAPYLCTGLWHMHLHVEQAILVLKIESPHSGHQLYS